MSPEERISDWQLHDSIRGHFAFALYKAMAENDKVWLITPDLGYGVLDAMKTDFSERFVNCGAAEQLALGIAIGLALEGKIPVVYSITSFLIFRPFEWIRNFIQHEGIVVHLVGSGLDNDYAHDGITHQPAYRELIELFNYTSGVFTSIDTYIPSKETAPNRAAQIIKMQQPSFTILRR